MREYRTETKLHTEGKTSWNYGIFHVEEAQDGPFWSDDLLKANHTDEAMSADG